VAQYRDELRRSREEAQQGREETRRSREEAVRLREEAGRLRERVVMLEKEVESLKADAGAGGRYDDGRASKMQRTGAAGAGVGANPDGFVTASTRMALDNPTRRPYGQQNNGYSGNLGNQANSGTPANPGVHRIPVRKPFVVPLKSNKQNNNNNADNNNNNNNAFNNSLKNAPNFVRTALTNRNNSNNPQQSGNSSNSENSSGNVAGIPLDAEGNLPGRLAGCEHNLVEMVMHEMLDRAPGVKWDDVAGLEFAKKSVFEVTIWPLMRPDLFTGLLEPAKGVLLFGPPGTGKTLIGKAIATESSARFFSISASSLTSKWHGQVRTSQIKKKFASVYFL
jgi:hypothetical protein